MQPYVFKYIPSKRRTIEIRIKTPSLVEVRHPFNARKSDVEDFVKSKTKWIEKHVEELANRLMASAEESGPKFSYQEITELADRALLDIPNRVKKYAPIVGVTIGKITIRNQRTRWGSCSSKGNLNFNCLLMMAPEYVRDYVVVHELCHRRHMDHSSAFWCDVERILPDYKTAKKWLSEHGVALLSRL